MMKNKNGEGRKKRVFVGIYLDDQEHTKIVQIAKKEDRSFSNLIRIAVCQFIERYQKDTDAA